MEDQDFDLLDFAAFQCPHCAGILLFWEKIDHYCDDCGTRLVRIGPIHTQTLELLRLARRAQRKSA